MTVTVLSLPLQNTLFSPDPPSDHRFFEIKALSKNPPTLRSKTHRRRQQKQPNSFPSSLPLRSRNPDEICHDIVRFAMQNKLKEVFTILDYMDQKGIRTKPFAFAHIISACARKKSITHGRLVHKYITMNGLENDTYLCRKLAKMYTICNSIDDVKRVLEDCGDRDVYRWNGLLRGNVLSGGRQYREVLSIFTEMRELGFDLNEYTFSNMIKSFSGRSAFWQGLKTHAMLIKNGLIDSPVLKTGLIYLYLKCGKVRLGCRMFDEFGENGKEKDVVVWGAMIAGLASNRLYRECLDYTRMMVKEGIVPNRVILTTILNVMGETRAYKLGREVHGFVVKTRSYAKQVVVQSALVDMYCKNGNMDMGRRVFYGSRERNAISWTSLMSGYASNGRSEEALKSALWMQQEGFKPDAVTVVTLLPVCGELKAVKPGKELHTYALKNYFLPNVAIETSLMGMYSKCGNNVNYASNLFNNMERRNVIAWTAMIDAYVENRCFEEAFGVFRSMQWSKHRPDSVLMGRVLRLCGKTKALRLGKEVHGHVLKKKFESIPFVSAEVMKMYGSCEAIGYAKIVFSGIRVKGTITWTSIMEVYRDNGLYGDVIRVFDEMVRKGFNPIASTYSVVLGVCDRAGFVDDACRILDLMSRRCKVKPSEEHFEIVVGLLMRVGRVEEAERYMRMSS